MEPPEIVVVCYGNICRSPMGEALLQRALDARLGPGAVRVTSAGIGADDGRPPSQGTIKAMIDREMDVRHYRSTYLTTEIAERAWRLYCMEEYQSQFVSTMIAKDREKVMLWGGEEVEDPLGSKQKAYDNVAKQLERLLPGVVEDIVSSLPADAG